MRGVGNLKARVALQRRRPSTEGGVSREGWETLGVYAAEIMHASAKEFVAAAATWTETAVLIHLRTLRTQTLTAGLRVMHMGQAYDVLEVVPDRPCPGYTELRAVAVEMEGVGVR